MIEKLGYERGDRLLIINADDFGITKATNQAITTLFMQGAITSASIMMPCSAARDAARRCARYGLSHIGIHLTLTSNGNNNDYKPVFQRHELKSLTTEEGYLHHDASYIEQNADPEEIRNELDAQIQCAISSGIDPTHLDSHAGSVMGIFHGRDFLDTVFDLCDKYRLPFNLPLQIVEQPFFTDHQKEKYKNRINSAKKRGILLIDDLVSLPYSLNPSEGYEDMKRKFIEVIKSLKPGITQMTTHPSMISDNLKAVTSHYREREMEYRLLIDSEIKQLLRREGARLVSWKEIRDLQRSMCS